jgi:hypothetical protein
MPDGHDGGRGCNDENLKKILSLAGHMMILAALKKHMEEKKIVPNVLNALHNLLIDSSGVYEDTHFLTILDALPSTEVQSRSQMPDTGLN